jgi:S-adenosylmethionine hydrolase
MAKPILTLITDFGHVDHFVGVMKGVILSICPGARIVDITHDIAPFAIHEGAYTIAEAYRYFPKGTVHVVVVDPGVGSERRPIVVEAASQFFVGPDNGVFSFVFDRESHVVRAITNSKLFLKPVSRTFHGRDIFSPVAARLADGASPERIGPRIRDYCKAEFAAPRPAGARSWKGVVLKIDRFGNIITNFRERDIPARTNFVMRVGTAATTILARHYAEQPPGQVFAIVGSSGYLEISMNQASAASSAGCKPGTLVRLALR